MKIHQQGILSLKLRGKEETSIPMDQMLSFQKLAMVRLLGMWGWLAWFAHHGIPQVAGNKKYVLMNLAMSTPSRFESDPESTLHTVVVAHHQPSQRVCGLPGRFKILQGCLGGPLG